MCKRHDQRASLLDRRRQKWRWSIALGNWLTLSIFSWMKGKPSLMSRLKNTRRKRKKEKKNNTRKRETSMYACVCVWNEKKRKRKTEEKSSNVDPVQSRKTCGAARNKTEARGVTKCRSMIKTGVQYRNNRWHLVCVCCSSREGEKKKFSFRGFTVRQRFSAVCLETRRRLLEYYFRSVWKATGRELPGQMERENE